MFNFAYSKLICSFYFYQSLDVFLSQYLIRKDKKPDSFESGFLRL